MKFPIVACIGMCLSCATISSADEKALPAVPTGEIEPLSKGPFCHIKTPGPGMTFTAGIPLRVLADGNDPSGYLGKTKKSEAQAMRFFVDGVLKATVEPAPKEYNYFETTLMDLPAGPHVLTAQSVNYGGSISKSWPVPITIEAPAAHAKRINLTEDLVLSGTMNLNWDDALVKGNGFRVRADAHWTGGIAIHNCLVIGLGSYASPGIEAATSGSIDIQGSTFDGTGALYLHSDGNSPITIRDNEFRASNLIQFVTNNPGKSPVIQFSGNNTGVKIFQANRVGSGIVRFERMSGWLIGGDSDNESNILIGPRCVLAMEGCRDFIVRGNYIRHDYFGGWSQGFALYCENCQNILAEHNVIRQSSWPVQSFAGEFRYNMIVDSGHNWVRVLTSGTKFHHNLLIHTGGYGGDVNAGLWLYAGRTNVSIYNNTFDGGAPVPRDFTNPIIEISTGCSLASLRNNVFTGVSKPQNSAARPIIARGNKETDADPRIAYADYNCFFNPHADGAAMYADGIVQGGLPAHDIKADPRFAEGGVRNYPINEAEVWNRRYKVSQVLAYFRARYTPSPGSPLIGKGDPADGPNSYIGAIGPGADAPDDRFGRFGEAAEVTNRP
ncbi:MAG TPA: hypothetical protein VFE47_24975 [Tepidisphaeraceae bacterium]|jgi:hypothetical protein|nr:hypothetical protein [Tepidisphaeraceae bacterium]